MLKRILNMLGMKKVIDSKSNAMHNRSIGVTYWEERRMKAYYFKVIENQGTIIVITKSFDAALARLKRDAGITTSQIEFMGNRDFAKAA